MEAVPAEPAAKKQKSQQQKCRQLCSLGTGECIHLMHFRCVEGKTHDFEVAVQRASFSMYQLEAGISDVRVCHPKCGEVCFILTFFCFLVELYLQQALHPDLPKHLPPLLG